MTHDKVFPVVRIIEGYEIVDNLHGGFWVFSPEGFLISCHLSLESAIDFIDEHILHLLD